MTSYSVRSTTRCIYCDENGMRKYSNDGPLEPCRISNGKAWIVEQVPLEVALEPFFEQVGAMFREINQELDVLDELVKSLIRGIVSNE